MSIDKYTFRPASKVYDFLDRGPAALDWTTKARVDKLVPTHCPFCGVQCAMYLKVSGQRVIGVEPREDYPVNQGRLCPKGVVAYQQVSHPDRLLYPLIRRQGKLVRASWNEALDLVVAKIQEIQAQHGKDAIAVLSGSSLTNERSYLAGKFARVALGTRHIDYNGRLCMVSAAAGNLRAFGIDRPANPLADLALADVLLMVGTNMPETFPVAIYYPWLARDRGAMLIAVDPRQTHLGRTADVFLQIRPGTDLALLNGLLHVVIEEGYTNPSFIGERTTGFDEVKRLVKEYTPRKVADICGVPAEDIVKAARLYGQADKAMLVHARGLEHQSKGTDNVSAAINLVLATGKLGRPGCGYGTLTGQGNGQGGREQGQKADQLPGARKIDDPEARRYICQVWGIPESELPQKGVAVTDMVSLMLKGELRGLLSACFNPIVSLPNANEVARALGNLDFFAVIDFFLSDTAARFADVVLAGSTWAEDDGVAANFEARTVKYNKAVDPPGDARLDRHILAEIAQRLGRGQYFRFDTAEDVFNELRIASHGGSADYYGITYEKIEAQNGVFWPCPTMESAGVPRLFEDGRSYHPDGKFIFTPVDHRPPAEVPDEDYPLYLTTGRVVYHYLSGNQTRRLGFLMENAPEPWVEIHPKTASRLGIDNGDRVRVSSRRGEIVVKALVVKTIRPDTVFIPYHWPPPVGVNLLTNPALDPVSRIPEYKIAAVRLERAEG